MRYGLSVYEIYDYCRNSRVGGEQRRYKSEEKVRLPFFTAEREPYFVKEKYSGKRIDKLVYGFYRRCYRSASVKIKIGKINCEKDYYRKAEGGSSYADRPNKSGVKEKISY